MKTEIIKTIAFQRAWNQLPPQMQKIVDRKVRYLAENPYHPSLQAHRLDQASLTNVWECYITINKRLLYQYKDGKLHLWNVGEHSIVDRVHFRHFKTVD